MRREFQRRSGIGEVLDQLDRELIGLKPVKTAHSGDCLAAADRTRAQAHEADVGYADAAHVVSPAIPAPAKLRWHCGWPSILHKLGFVRRGQLVSVTRDDLVGQYIGHTAPKTKEILKKAMGGVLVHRRSLLSLHRPDNERDYGQEAIEILLQVMENRSATIWW